MSSGADKTASRCVKGKFTPTEAKKASTNKRKRLAADEQTADREETPSNGDMPKTPTSVRKGGGRKKQVTKEAKFGVGNEENKAVDIESCVGAGNGSD